MNFKSILLTLALLSPLPASAQQPNADAILKGSRMSAALVKLDKGLTGKIQQGRTKVPLTLFLMGKDIQFQFTDGKTPKIFHLRMGDRNFDLYEQVNGKMTKFPDAKISSPVAGTDLTYEDLSMRFLYWPDAKHEGIEKVNGQECYKIRVDRPKGTPGNYQVVYVWVHRKYGAFMQIKAYDNHSGLLKAFEVEDVMKIDDDLWTLRKMQVSTHDPKTGRRKSITKVIMDTARKTMGPRGLR